MNLDDIEVVGNDDMVLDMDAFDFSMIDQDIEEVAPEKAEVAEVEEEKEEEVAEESEEEEEVAEEVEEEEVELEEGDESEVDYTAYEINLPSGETVVLADLVQGFKSAAEIEAARAEVERVKTEFEEKAGGLAQYLELAQLEADKVIDDYKGFDWATLSREDHQAYVENREFLDKYLERKQELVEAYKAVKEQEETEKRNAIAEKARSANALLARELTGWGEQMYKDLCKYAVEVGYSEEDILACTDAATFKLLHKAMQHDKGVQTVKAKVKRIGGAPKKVVKAAPAKQAVSEATKKQNMLKKAQESGDMAAMFHLLED